MRNISNYIAPEGVCLDAFAKFYTKREASQVAKLIGWNSSDVELIKKRFETKWFVCQILASGNIIFPKLTIDDFIEDHQFYLPREVEKIKKIKNFNTYEWKLKEAI